MRRPEGFQPSVQPPEWRGKKQEKDETEYEINIPADDGGAGTGQEHGVPGFRTFRIWSIVPNGHPHRLEWILRERDQDQERTALPVGTGSQIILPEWVPR